MAYKIENLHSAPDGIRCSALGIRSLFSEHLVFVPPCVGRSPVLTLTLTGLTGLLVCTEGDVAFFYVLQV